jgi:hypothetical protein
VGVDDPQLRAGLADLLLVALAIQRVALQLRIFTTEHSLVIRIERLGGGQGMAGAAGIAAQADLDLPGQVHQLAGSPRRRPAAR